AAVERVEVYRGLSPLGFGAAAPGGAVNVVTRPAAAARELRVARGAFDTWEAAGTAGGQRGAFAGLVHAGYLGSRGDFPYLDDHGTPFNAADDSVRGRQNDRSDAASGYATATWTMHPGVSLAARGELFRRGQGLPGRGSVPTLSAALHRTRARS